MAKKGKQKFTLTRREEEVMQLLWAHGPMTVRELVALYPEPQPHVNTVSTQVRILEEKGFVAHQPAGSGYAYYAVADKSTFRDRSLGQIIRGYFDNSYLNVVSTLVKDEKITVEELRELIDMIEHNDGDKK